MSILHNVNILQNVLASEVNSSTINLSAGETFTGTSASTLGVVGIQVSLKTDQNCIIYVEQSPDGSNWDISDYFNYYSSINNFGITVQAINSYVRVRVYNSGLSSTTYFRLQTCLCPIVEAVPRSLDENGYFKTAIYTIEDEYGFEVENTPMNEMRVVEPYRLVGATFTGTILDPNFWVFTSGTAGSATLGDSQLVLSTGTTANNTTSIQSVRAARYLGASSNRFRAIIRLPDSGTANNVRKWGMFNSTDGAYYQLSGTEFSVNTIKGGSVTKIASGGFNGVYGNSYILNTSVQTYEIYITNGKVYFSFSGKLLHTITASSTTWTNTMHLPIRFENNNSGGSSTNVAINIRVATISRLGKDLSAPTSKYLSGQTSSILKYGPGVLHQLQISGVTNNSVITLFDNTAINGTILYSSGAMGSITTPFGLDMKGMPFFTGLTASISAANSNATIIYE